MTDPVISGAFCPRSSSIFGRGTTAAALHLGDDTSGSPRYALGHFDPLDWVWDDVVKTMSARWKAGPLAATLVASGERKADDQGELREVDGVTTDLFRVVPWRRNDPVVKLTIFEPTYHVTRTRTRPQGEQRAREQVEQRPLGTLALDVTGRRGMILSDHGPSLLGGLLTQGGLPRSSEIDPGRPVSPTAVRVGGRFATWAEGGFHHHSLPIAFEWTPTDRDNGTTAAVRITSFREPAGQDVSFWGAATRPVHAWGALRPLDIARRRFAPPNVDPDSLDANLHYRWAVLIEMDADKILGDDKPPPKEPPPKEPQPPPGTPPPSPWPPKPPAGDDELDEEDREDEELDGVQRRKPFVDPNEPLKPAPDDGEVFTPGADDGVFTPGADTWVPGTGLPNPGATMGGDAVDQGQLIKGCPLADPPGIGWVPSPTGEPGDDDGTVLRPDVGGRPGLGFPVRGLTPGQPAELLLEDGSRVHIQRVPSLEELTDAQKAALVDMVRQPGVARVPSPIGVIGGMLSMKGWGALVARQLNAISEIVEAALVGGRYSHYQGNLGVINSNVPVNGGNSPGINEQFIGAHFVDPDSNRPIPPALHLFQSIESQRQAVVANRPALRFERITKGQVIAATALIDLRKRTHGGSIDSGSWLQATAPDGSHPVDVSNDGRGYFAGGVGGEHHTIRDYYTEQNVDNVTIPTYGAQVAVLDEDGKETGAGMRLSRRGSKTSLVVDGGDGGSSEVVADKVTCDVLDPYAVVFEPYEFPFTPPVFSSIAPGLWTRNASSTPADGPPFDPYWFDGSDSRRLAYADELPSGGTTLPPGSVQAFAGPTTPTGWLDCDGSAVSRTDYADLFAAIGTTWGSGDGATTFNLPDFRGRALIGAGTGPGLSARTLGQSVGAETHALNQAEMPPHTHAMPVGTGPGSAAVAGPVGLAGGLSTASAGAGLPHNNMQPSAVVKWIIKT